MTQCLSLKSLFEEIQRNWAPNKINRQSQDFLDLKELGKRFALSFGLDAIKNREAVAALHRAGILFAALPHEGVEWSGIQKMFKDLLVVFGIFLLIIINKLNFQFTNETEGFDEIGECLASSF